MAKTTVTQFNLYVDGVLHGTAYGSHRVYDLGYSTDPNQTIYSVYGDMDLPAVRNMDMVANDFMTVSTARIEASTTITIDIPEFVMSEEELSVSGEF